MDISKERSSHQEQAHDNPKALDVHAADDETAAYTGSPIAIDKATDRRLFWKINGRVLVCMLGVFSLYVADGANGRHTSSSRWTRGRWGLVRSWE